MGQVVSFPILKQRTAADVRLIAKAMHKYANRIEEGDLGAVDELIDKIPALLEILVLRFLVASEAMEKGASIEQQIKRHA